MTVFEHAAQKLEQVAENLEMQAAGLREEARLIREAAKFPAGDGTVEPLFPARQR